MALKNTTNQLKQLLDAIVSDVAKAEGGNKAAAQRVRTGTIKLEKVAKLYRKESIADEKKNKGKPKKAKKKAAPKKAAPKKKVARRATAKIPAKRRRA